MRLKDLSVAISNPMQIYYDNLNNIQLAKNPVFHAKTKHIEVHYHFVCEWVLSSKVELRYVHNDRQVAVIFTKALGIDKLQQFSEMLGIQHLDVPQVRGRAAVGKDNSCDDEPELESVEGKRRDDKTNQR